jgi:hypothetical protein
MLMDQGFQSFRSSSFRLNSAGFGPFCISSLDTFSSCSTTGLFQPQCTSVKSDQRSNVVY